MRNHASFERGSPRIEVIMQEIIILTPRQLERIVADGVARGIENVKPLLLKAANEYQHNKKVLEAVGKTHE